MVQRLEVTCQACQGAGRRLSKDALCKPCGGQGQRKETRDLKVQIPAGVTDSHRILLRGEGEQAPGQRTGDLQLHVHVQEHPRFLRMEEHLVYHAQVPLAEALAGCRLSVEQLDGQSVSLRTPGGEVVRPGSRWRLRGHGMPVLGQPAVRGDLLVKFDVVFPDRLDASVSGQLRALLSSEPGSTACGHDEGPRPPQHGRLSGFLSALRALVWGPAQAKDEGLEDGASTEGIAAEEEHLILEQLSDRTEREDAGRRPHSKL